MKDKRQETQFAWQARETKRNNLLLKIQAQFELEEERINARVLYSFLLFLLGKQLWNGDCGFSYPHDYPDIPPVMRNRILECCGFALLAIARFTHYEHEKQKMHAELLAWVCTKVTRPIQITMHVLDAALLKEVYGVDSPTDRVPIG